MSNLQTDKQTPVSLPEICAPRPILLQDFDRASKNQYIYVHAPAGYGKTISTLLWLKKRNRKTVWISLDSYDNTPVLFYRLFCRSLLSALSEDERLQEIKSPSFHSSPVEHTVDMLSRLTFENSDYALVLDDLHAITNEEILKSLPYVIRRLPLTVTVLILSRNHLPESFAELNEQGKISFIGSRELSFSSEEIRRHFAGYGRFITASEANRIYEFTEGWVIALNAIAMSGEIDMSNKAQSVSFGSFLERNVWSRLDNAMRDFLMATSVPDGFTQELCEQITGGNDCQEMLNTLIGSNVYLSLVGAEYRYHNLFLEFLRDKLNQSSLDKPELNKRVAQYYLTTGDFLTAKRYAVKSGDAGAISQAVRNFYSTTTFSLDEYIEFHKLYNLQVLPEPICNRMPLLYIPHIFYSYATGDIQKVSYYFDKLYPLFPVIAATQPEIMEHVNGIVMLDCRIRMGDLPNRFEKLPAITHKHVNLQSPTFTFQMPFLHRCCRDFYELTDPELNHAVKDFSSGIIKQNVDLMFVGAEAGLLMEKNQLQAALKIALSLRDTIREDISPEFAYAILLLIAEIYLQSGQKEMHTAAMKEVSNYIRDNSASYLLKNLSAYVARAAIENGDKTSAGSWLDNYYVNDTSLSEFYKSYRTFTTARAHLVLGQTEKAVYALQKLRTLAQNYDRLLDLAEADVLLSVTEWISGKKKEAQDRLLSVLVSVKQYGFIRVISNEGKAILPVLSSLIRRIQLTGGLSEESRQDSSHMDGLLKFSREVYLAAYEQSKHFKGLICSPESTSIRLSDQQKHVLELLAGGYKFTEIVEKTGLTLNTIRTHAKKAYLKLDANNASDAVVRARELGILK